MSKPYRVLIEPAAWSQIMALDVKQQSRVVEAIEALEENARPSGVVKLSGADNLYRVRTGDYRIIYQIDADVLVVIVVKVGHHRDVYRER